MKRFDGRVVAITGAGSGIGRALAEAFADLGARLSLSDVDEGRLAETAEIVDRRHATPFTSRVDVSDRAQVEAWAAATQDRFGQVNIIINNAGVALSGTVSGLDMADYEWVMGINFWGVVYGTKAFLPLLEASGEGHIVNISSVFGLTSQPLMSGYNASKYAVRGFTESLRQDLELRGAPVSATCVHPGGIKTNIARAARIDGSVEAVVGFDKEASTAEFDRFTFTAPAGAARAIIRGVRRNRRRVLIGADARVYDWSVRLLPASYQRVVTGIFRWRSRA